MGETIMHITCIDFETANSFDVVNKIRYIWREHENEKIKR
jgi:hypothetical protein